MDGSEARKWHEYEEEYRRYGINMEPAGRVHVHRKQPSSLWDRLMANQNKVIATVLVLGVAFILFIGAIVWITSLTKQISDLTAENQDLTVKLESIEFQIKEANSIASITEKAEKLGMVPAESKQYVHLKTDKTPKDLGLVVEEGKVIKGTSN